MTLIVMTGAPGTGKSTLARALALDLGAVWLRVDTVEAGITASALAPESALDAGYRVLVGVALDNLGLGRAVIADAVNGWRPAQEWWRLAAAQSGARLVILAPTVPPELHKARVEARHARDPETPDWESVLAREVAPWPGSHAIDMSGEIAEAVAKARLILEIRSLDR